MSSFPIERNLELELPELEAARNLQILLLVTEYGHGRCHELASTLSSYMERPIGLVMDDETGEVIHSCVVLDGNRTLDAYGINTVQTTVERYARYTHSGASWGQQEAAGLIIDEGSEVDQKAVLSDICPLMKFIGVNVERSPGPEPEEVACAL